MSVPYVGCGKCTFHHYPYAVVSSVAFQSSNKVVLALTAIVVEYFKLKCFIPV